MIQTKEEERAAPSKSPATIILSLHMCPEKSPPLLTLGLVRQHVLTKSVVEMTLQDIPAQVLHPQPGEQLAHSKCSLNSSSSSDKHPRPPGRSRLDEVTRENEKGHQQEGNEFSRAHGPTGCFASETGYALPLVQ